VAGNTLRLVTLRSSGMASVTYSQFRSGHACDDVDVDVDVDDIWMWFVSSGWKEKEEREE